jgi:hypothetical protein
MCELQSRRIETLGLPALVLPVNTRRWVLADNTTAFKRVSMLEFQYSSIFGIEILAAVGTYTCRASPTMENASVDDTDVATTFFFITYGKTHILASPYLYS